MRFRLVDLAHVPEEDDLEPPEDPDRPEDFGASEDVPFDLLELPLEPSPPSDELPPPPDEPAPFLDSPPESPSDPFFSEDAASLSEEAAFLYSSLR